MSKEADEELAQAIITTLKSVADLVLEYSEDAAKRATLMEALASFSFGMACSAIYDAKNGDTETPVTIAEALAKRFVASVRRIRFH